MDYIGEKILQVHSELQGIWSHLCRVAVAIYDNETDQLKTFVNSTSGHESLMTYSARLADVPSLKELAEARRTRVVGDIHQFADRQSEHSRWLIKEGFRSSYTVPLFGHDRLLGFLFFDADVPDYFASLIVKSLSVYAELISVIIANELAPIHTLHGALNTAKHLTHHRDEETAFHIRRMSHYSHLIACKLAPSKGLSDEYVEFVLQYSPLHDIGKIAVADCVLLKPGKLTVEEYEQIKQHVVKGEGIIDSVLSEFDLNHFEHLDILKNIIACHHERYDGSGYPRGLSGEAIPLEGRIAAVADVLDALTSPRPYKEAWPYERALAYLADNAGVHFDPECVRVVVENKDEFLGIYNRFRDNGH